MSGIAVILNLDGAPLDAGILGKMTEAAAHRGPDGRGDWVGGPVGLAHLALQTTPEALRERQPLRSDGRDLVLVADARVDNRPELIPLLRARGCLPAEEPTDADLILAAYCCWGEECPRQIIGDFAFALWDGARERLFCARDALGIKPLHYARVGDVFCVASEAQQILQHPAVSRRLDEVALADHLTNNCQDDERTVFEAVRRVPPAHVLIVGQEGVRLQRYWTIDLRASIRYRRDEEYAAHYLEIFRRAVGDRLRTQAGSVGLMISGGLDSCSIAAVAQRLRREDERTPQLAAHSYAFEQLKECDEREYSRAVAAQLGVRIQYLDTERFWLLGDKEAFQPTLETPFMGWESADRHIMQALRSEGARVLLTGHAGRYGRLGNRPLVYADRLLRGQFNVFGELRRFAEENGIPYIPVLRYHIVRPLIPDSVRRVKRGLGGKHSPSLVPEWVGAAFGGRTGIAERLAHAQEPVSLFEARMPERVARYRPGSVGRAVYWHDRVAAGYGIEVRHPFLDRRLIDFLAAIPAEQIYRAGCNRWILRRAMAGLLPDKVVERLDKTRFLPFLDLSLRERARPQITALFDRPRLGAMGVVDSPRLLWYYRNYSEGRLEQGKGAELWFPITLEMWVRQHAA